MEIEHIPHSEHRRQEPYPLLLSLTLRSLIFIFLLSGALALLYISGCFQLFLDSNIIFILRFLSASAVLLGLISLLTMLESFAYVFILRRPLLLLWIVPAFICLISAAVLVLFSRSVLFLADGI